MSITGASHGVKIARTVSPVPRASLPTATSAAAAAMVTSTSTVTVSRLRRTRPRCAPTTSATRTSGLASSA
ncbi:hypothetical protein G3I59_09595 [Amycolatopsis rubida]|uniref:Uncharacterized protein n=1 Tax=Amycolatopsis rubida TaxID=112413 RepID=A0ABX0BJZ6_9PSEU|nr:MULTISPECIES: hypothetical protein [Amycolatopsis]MYW90851.1 hypothetical protein [Amycolatopsis rubida]NEC55834.1 hypothetical protein [Amycolatopsis rubida]